MLVALANHADVGRDFAQLVKLGTGKNSNSLLQWTGEVWYILVCSSNIVRNCACLRSAFTDEKSP